MTDEMAFTCSRCSPPAALSSPGTSDVLESLVDSIAAVANHEDANSGRWPPIGEWRRGRLPV